MTQRTFYNAALALGMTVRMQFNHGFFVLLFCFEYSGKINHKPGNRGKHKFCSHKGKYFSHALRVCKKNGDGLVACGDKNRNKRSRGYHSVGIKIGCGNGKAALRHNAKQSADY